MAQKNLIDKLGGFLAEQARRAQNGLERILYGKLGVTETLEASTCHIWSYKGSHQGNITVTIAQILNNIDPELQGVKRPTKEKNGNKFFLRGEVEEGNSQNVKLKIYCRETKECRYRIDRGSDFRDKEVMKLE